MSDSRPRLMKILILHGKALSEVVSQRESMSAEACLQLEASCRSDRDLIQRFAENDPTDGKSRTQWLVKTYIQDEHFKLEDLGRAHAALAAFERFKRKFPVEQRELSRFKKLRDLEALVDPFVKAEERARLTRDLSSATGREKRRLEEWKARDESIVVQEGEDIPTITVPMTEFASKWWGRGTKWCTAAEQNTAFAHYHEAAPLLVIVCSDGAKFQMHVDPDTFQFRDNTDKNVSKGIIQKRWSEFQSLFYWAVQQDGLSLKEVPEEHKTPELCRLAVAQNGRALRYVPEDKKTLELYRFAIEQNGQVLEYVPEKYKPALYKLAVQQDGMALKLVPENLRNPELCRMAIEQNWKLLHYIPENKKTPELCRLAIEQDGWALYSVPKNKRTPALCLLAIEQNGRALYSIPEYERTPELCRLAVEQNGLALEYVPEEYKPEFYYLAIQQDGRALKFALKNKWTLELCRLAVEQNGLALECVPKEYRTPELYQMAIKQNGMALGYVDKITPELCRIAVQQDGRALVYVPGKYRSPELLALISPTQPKWNVDILKKLNHQSQPSQDSITKVE
jgi:Domain of unknown function (DUF4116)